MKHTVIHPKVNETQFVNNEEYETRVFDSLEEAQTYYTEVLKIPVNNLLVSRRTETIDARTQALTKLHDELQNLNMNDILSLPTAHFVDNILSSSASEGRMFLKLSMPNIWKTHFYCDKNYKGKKFTLSIKGKPWDWDLNLSDNGMNDCISSIDTGKLVVLTLCAQHANFKGDWLWLWKDDKNLANDGWDNRISSVAITGASPDAMIKAILAAI